MDTEKNKKSSFPKCVGVKYEDNGVNFEEITDNNWTVMFEDVTFEGMKIIRTGTKTIRGGYMDTYKRGHTG